MNKFICFLVLLSCTLVTAQTKRQLKSPNDRIRFVLEAGKSIRYSVYFDNRPVLVSSTLDIILGDGRSLGKNPAVRSISLNSVKDSIICPVPEKRQLIRDEYIQMTVRFKEPFRLEVRVYNDGVAYRLLTQFRDSIIVKNESAQFNFPSNYLVWYPEMHKRPDMDIFHTSYEEPYLFNRLDSISADKMCFTPVLVNCESGIKALITESNIEDYPGMFLQGTGKASLEGVFAGYPAEEAINGGEYPQVYVTKREDYIAHTLGKRSFPWRVIALSGSDKEIPSNDIVYRLAAPSRIADPSWIHPGKGTDEWIIGINLFNVPFVAGINTATYKYYIDFAKKFGFDRIMMDAGWSDYKDLFKINPNLNMDELAAYARSQGIKISMWTLALTLDRQLDSALDQFNKWGVDFIMTDFIDRDDQKTVNFYYRIAEACARHQIMIMYHGAYKPAGFGRTYPNAITRESVMGSEYNIWSDKVTPRHDLLLPYTRMVSGPMDYEPGILDNASKSTFRPIAEKVMSMGTRSHQLAMFVVYDNPMQIFSGNPSQGLLEPQFMELLGSIPSVWDETIVLDGKVGEYIITARKKGLDWFIGAMTDWTPRELLISLDFLDEGDYEAACCEDGINANRYASDYLLSKKDMHKGEAVKIKMADGGGFLLRLRKK